jgi:hypothetical protein
MPSRGNRRQSGRRSNGLADGVNLASAGRVFIVRPRLADVDRRCGVETLQERSPNAPGTRAQPNHGRDRRSYRVRGVRVASPRTTWARRPEFRAREFRACEFRAREFRAREFRAREFRACVIDNADPSRPCRVR